MEGEKTESGAVLCGEKQSGGRGEIDNLEKIINKTTGNNIDKATKKTINKTVQKNKTKGSTINDKITGNIDKINKMPRTSTRTPGRTSSRAPTTPRLGQRPQVASDG